jgi:hypothetical protein
MFMPIWRSVIDNIATYRTKTLQLDVERHTASCTSPKGQTCFAAPRYSMMLVAIGALEPGIFSRVLKRPLSAVRFKSAMAVLDGYALTKETEGRVIFHAPEKNLFADWLPATFNDNPRPGAMVGFIQLRPSSRLDEVVSEVLPVAVEDFNRLSADLGLEEKVSTAILKRLASAAKSADKRMPKGKVMPPKHAWRYLFEQE